MIKESGMKDQFWLNGLLAKLVTGQPLPLRDSRRFFALLFTGAVSFTKAKSFLLLLAQKGETADELLGCLQALQALERPVKTKISGLMDTCGTGGDVYSEPLAHIR